MEICKYRGYDILPQGSQWCVSVYPTRADVPLLSTLRTLAPRKEEAVAEAKQRIDRILSRLKKNQTFS
jgi:hypothetical protein